MKIFVKEQLSEHKYKTPQGYLICTDAIIARTGKQTYKKSTFFPDAEDADSDIEVDRHEADVFDEKTMASFENMPITIDHPNEEVNSTNNKEYSVGYVRDVHKGEFEGKPVMMANLIFTDEAAIQKIENGEMLELSCGYDCDVKDENNPYQTNIRGNHVALCQRGRAGIAKIQDSIESSTKKIEELGETRFIEYDEKEGKYFIASGDSRFDVGFNSKEEAKEFWLKNKDFIRKRVARDSKVKDDAEMVTTQCYIFSRDYRKILTQERVGPTWPGIAVPGGHVKPGETPLEACVREVREETGLEVRQLRLFGTHNYDCEEDGRSIALLFTTNDFYGQLHDCDEGINKWYDVEDVLASPKCAEGFQSILSKCINGSFVGDTVVDDALVQNEQELNFIKNARQIKNANGISFVLKNDEEGYASPDGQQWYSGRVRVLPERDGGRKQNSRWLRVSFNGREAVMSLAKLKYASQYGDIPSGYEIDHLNGNHMDDRMSNYELVTSTENGIRNRVRIAARRQQDVEGAVSRSAITKAFGKYELDLLEKYNDYDRFTFRDSSDKRWFHVMYEINGQVKQFDCQASDKEDAIQQLDEFTDYDKIKHVSTSDSKEVKDMIKDTHEFRLAKKKNDYDEYVVKEYVNGKYREDGSYYTDDWDDAVGTLKDIAKRLGLTVKQQGSGYIADAATNDKLVEEPKAWAEMKTNIIAKGYKLDKEGKTIFGRHHLEFVSNNVIDANDFRNECAKLDEVVSKVENKYGTPSTYNFGLDNSGKLHAIIDIDSKYVKDEMPDAVKTALKIVNCKK